MQKMNVQENIGIKGTIRINTYRAGTLNTAAPYAKQYLIYRNLFHAEKKSESLKEFYKNKMIIMRSKFDETLKAGYLKTPVVQKNLIMQQQNYGKDLIVQRLVGINTYSLNILFCEIGTGNTTPTILDTGLTTPSVRSAVSFQEDFGYTDAVLQFFFPDLTLPNGTYYEMGSFVDGSATIGSGQLFNHALFGTPYVKISGQDTTIEIDFNIS